MICSSNLDSWDNTILKNLATINYGKSPKEILSSYGEYPVVGTGGTERYGNKFIYDGESIVLGRKGTIDRVHFVSGRFWTIDTAYYLSDFVEANPRWLFYYLQSVDLRQLNEATGVPSLSRDQLYKIEVLTPPPDSNNPKLPKSSPRSISPSNKPKASSPSNSASKPA